MGERWRGVEDLHLPHAEPVLGVRLLGHVASEHGRKAGSVRCRKDLVRPLVEVGDPDLPPGAGPEPGGDRRQWHDRAREHALAEQGVQECALATLELPEYGQVKAALLELAREGADAFGGTDIFRADRPDCFGERLELSRD
ncbi:hypothetical protein DSECCO2_288720 [anaerobic digester metagenome]